MGKSDHHKDDKCDKGATKISDKQNIAACIFCKEEFQFDGDPYSIQLKCPYCYHHFYYVYCDECNICIPHKGQSRLSAVKCHGVDLSHKFCSTCDEWKLWDLNVPEDDKWYEEMEVNEKKGICECMRIYYPYPDEEFVKSHAYPLKNKLDSRKLIYSETIKVTIDDQYNGLKMTRNVHGHVFELDLGKYDPSQGCIVFEDHIFGRCFNDKVDVVFNIVFDDHTYKIEGFNLIYEHDITSWTYGVIKQTCTINHPSGEIISFDVNEHTINNGVVFENRGLYNHASSQHGDLIVRFVDKFLGIKAIFATFVVLLFFYFLEFYVLN